MTSGTDSYFWKLIPIITSLLALVVIYANARFGIRNKQADLLIHFHKQYDELQKKRAELLTAQSERAAGVQGTWSKQRTEVEAAMFFDRFWSLQFDQFLAWYEGYVPTRLYVYWAYSRWRELHHASAEWHIEGKQMDSTLLELKTRWQNNPDRSSSLSIHVTMFLGLMFSLKQKETAGSVDMEALLRQYGPSRLRQQLRKLFGAY